MAHATLWFERARGQEDGLLGAAEFAGQPGEDASLQGRKGAGKVKKRKNEGGEMETPETGKPTFLTFVQIGLITALMLVLIDCSGDRQNCCSDVGGIRLDFSSLATGPLIMFTVNRVDGFRVYNTIKREGNSLRCLGREEVTPGNWKDAAVMLLFHKLACGVCKITAEVNGHGPEARISAAQRDGTTHTAVSRDRRVLTLNATMDNPFIYVILSGQEAEWIELKLE